MANASETSIPALASHIAANGQGRICSFFNQKKGQERGPKGRKVVYGDGTDFVVAYAGFRYDNLITTSLRELKAMDPDVIVAELAAKKVTAQVRDWTKSSPIFSDRDALARVAGLLELDVAPDANLTTLRNALKASGPRTVAITRDHVVEAIASLKSNLEGRVLAAFLRTTKARLIDAVAAGEDTAKLIKALAYRAGEESITVDLAALEAASDTSSLLEAWDEVEAIFQAGGAAKDVNRDSFDVLMDGGKVIRGARIYKKASGHDTSISLDEWLKRPIPGTINMQVLVLSTREIAPPINGPIPKSVSGPAAVAKRQIESRLRVGKYRSYRMEPLSVAVYDAQGNLDWRRYTVSLDASGAEVFHDALETNDKYVTIAGNQVRRGGEWGLKMGGEAVAAASQVAADTGKPLTANASVIASL